MAAKGKVCVTGAGGYVASWLVKILLSNGYTVHGTVRDPHSLLVYSSSVFFPMSLQDIMRKNAHLKKLDKASENLKLFKVDLLDYHSLSAPISGCNGVFHVASPVPSSSVPDPEARKAHDGTCLWKHFHARQFATASCVGMWPQPICSIHTSCYTAIQITPPINSLLLVISSTLLAWLPPPVTLVPWQTNIVYGFLVGDNREDCTMLKSMTVKGIQVHPSRPPGPYLPVQSDQPSGPNSGHLGSAIGTGPSLLCQTGRPEVQLMEPAVKGTLNVLKACSEANINRVVFVSSVAAVSMNPDWPKGQAKDETCWSDKEYCRRTNNWYCLSKTEAESEALKFAKISGLDVVTVCPTLILGPMLQSTTNASSLVLIKLLKEGYDELENRLRMIIDVRDLAEALQMTYEKPEAEGRYICTAHTIRSQDLVEILRRIYPNYNYPKKFTEGKEEEKICSEKLQKLGWQYRPLEETLVDSVESYRQSGLLD
ncbi:NAD(P)-binding Rossmann-fold superfamily protein [Actinidia rufa]|uniref:Dihydroflavonol 4-reductase n=1 Tax=Actinidia rufa TaxID=165716 RepID=A0A7J0EIW5_9ERIC|nr:NAD(P)-binding Rossmann-fold superfamily protein [Actinidia rufa]